MKVFVKQPRIYLPGLLNMDMDPNRLTHNILILILTDFWTSGTLGSVQCAVYSVQCATCNIAVCCSAHSTASTLQIVAFNVQCSACRLQCAEFTKNALFQCAVFSMQCAVCSVQCECSVPSYLVSVLAEHH